MAQEFLKADLTIEWREFDDTMRRYLDETQKDIGQAMDEKAFQLAGGFGSAHPGALQLTEHAEASKIGQQLSATVESVTKVTKTGKVSTIQKRSFGDDEETKKTLAARIVNARLVAKGQSPIWGAELRKESQKLTNARIKSVNFIRSGWIGAIRGLASRVNRSGATSGVKQKGQLKGYAVPSSYFSWNPGAEIVNTALNTKSGQPSRMVAVAERGLAKAVVAVTRDIAQYLERRLQKIADRHNAR